MAKNVMFSGFNELIIFNPCKAFSYLYRAMWVYMGISLSFSEFNIWFSFIYLGHETCVELLLEQEVFQKMEGNAFSPLHCAV